MGTEGSIQLMRAHSGRIIDAAMTATKRAEDVDCNHRDQPEGGSAQRLVGCLRQYSGVQACAWIPR